MRHDDEKESAKDGLFAQKDLRMSDSFFGFDANMPVSYILMSSSQIAIFVV